MSSNSNNFKKFSFGSLGSCQIIHLEEDNVDIYAKYTTSAGSYTCPDGTIVGRGGPSFPDDAPNCPSGPAVTA